MAHRLTTCTFCGVGCGLYLETSGNRVVGVSPSISHPANEGRICLRGWNVHEVISSPDRLKTPMIRKNDQLQEVAWDEAYNFIASRLREIREKYGPDSIALLNSPRCCNEESYLLQKLARTIIKTNNVDHGAGVYSNNSTDVLLDMIGSPATTNSYKELTGSEVIIVSSVDLGKRLPTVGGTVIRAKLKGSKLIVTGTRSHRIVKNSDLFLQNKPGTDALLYGIMAKVIVDHGLMNLPFIKKYCRNYDKFLSTIVEYDLLEAAEECGVHADLIETAALAYAGARTASILYSTGSEYGDAEAIRAMVNLCLLCGHIGKEGSGIFALTEHNNLQGVCDVGMLPDRLPGYGSVTDDSIRSEFERHWNTSIPSKPGVPAKWVLSDRGMGTIHALWLCRYDPVSTAFFGNAEESLRKCDFVLLQHLFLTETAKYAHVVLPTAIFGEEQVTFTSGERRIQIAKQVIDPPAGISPAWRQIADIAHAMGADWNYASASEIMDEIGDVAPFYSGANHENLAREYGRQWPCTKDRPLGTQFMFSEGIPVHAFKFIPVERPRETIITNEEYPFLLVLGHSLYYWNKNVLIRHSETLKREYQVPLMDYPEGFAGMHPDDAKVYGIRDGDRILIKSETGYTVTVAALNHEIRRGTLFVPFFVKQVEQQILGPEKSGVHLIRVRVEKEVE
jgi:predicted molibdopterin-dependent oxidoreductase YjgC